jgi:hypothetical protein
MNYRSLIRDCVKKSSQLNWNRKGGGTDTKFLKAAGFAYHKASATAAVLGECIKDTLHVSSIYVYIYEINIKQLVTVYD